VLSKSEAHDLWQVPESRRSTQSGGLSDESAFRRHLVGALVPNEDTSPAEVDWCSLVWRCYRAAPSKYLRPCCFDASGIALIFDTSA
jgi:hypothetical protein